MPAHCSMQDLYTFSAPLGLATPPEKHLKEIELHVHDHVVVPNDRATLATHSSKRANKDPRYVDSKASLSPSWGGSQMKKRNYLGHLLAHLVEWTTIANKVARPPTPSHSGCPHAHQNSYPRGLRGLARRSNDTVSCCSLSSSSSSNDTLMVLVFPNKGGPLILMTSSSVGPNFYPRWQVMCGFPHSTEKPKL